MIFELEKTTQQTRVVKKLEVFIVRTTRLRVQVNQMKKQKKNLAALHCYSITTAHNKTTGKKKKNHYPESADLEGNSLELETNEK